VPRSLKTPVKTYRLRARTIRDRLFVRLEGGVVSCPPHAVMEPTSSKSQAVDILGFPYSHSHQLCPKGMETMFEVQVEVVAYARRSFGGAMMKFKRTRPERPSKLVPRDRNSTTRSYSARKW
jgi:hypothetical protein